MTWSGIGPIPGSRRALVVLSVVVLALGCLLGVPLSAAADGPTTFATPTPIAIPAAGAANQTGPASVYPSTLAVSGMSGPVTTVTVTLANLTHPTLGDIDALLVAPGGRNLMVLSDVADPQLTFVGAANATLTFADSASGPVPVTPGANVPSGTYRPTNSGPGADSLPAPAPAPSTSTTLAEAFTGIDPNGTWQLFLYDDNTGDLGQLAGGWSLTVTTETAAVATTTSVATSGSPSTTGDPVTFTATVSAGGTPVTSGTVQFSVDGTVVAGAVAVGAGGRAETTVTSLTEGTHLVRATYSGATGFLGSTGTVSQRVDNPTVVTDTTFCNTGAITVPGQGTAQPYPSNVRVSGLTGQITEVTATLNGLSHTEPIDLDVLLAGPTPTTNVFLLSDAGGQTAASNATLTFDDDAAGTVPSPIVSGTFRPTRVADESADAMPAPAPTPTSATTMATFDGASPNGVWSLWVVDDASGDSGSIAGGWCLTVTSQVATTTALAATPNPSQAGQQVTLTATVTSAGSPVPSGTVQFRDGATPLGAAPVAVAANGTATLQTDALTVGTHTITAAYGGTSTLAESSDDIEQVVEALETQTVLASDPNPSVLGQAVTLTATVTSAGTPVTSGTVVFSDGGAPLGAPVPLGPNGTFTFTTIGLGVGPHPLTAHYAATGPFGSSDGSLTQDVAQVLSTTSITSSTNPSSFGQSVTFAAAVTAGGVPVTAGTVQFLDGPSPIGSPVPMAADGTAALIVNTLSAGAHTITAAFGGTTDIAPSSRSLDQDVTRAVSVTTVISGGSPSTFGQAVTFTATVTSGGAAVGDGSVTFSDGATTLCDAVPLAGGTATCTALALGGGTHTITATFSGTADIGGSTGTAAQVVTPASTTTTVTTSGSPSALGDPVTFTARVSATGGAPDPGIGSVEFRVDAGTVTVVGLATDGTADFAAADLDGGPHTITARFTGTVDHLASEGSVAQQVTVTADAGGPYTVAEGASLTLDAGLSSPGAAYGWDVNDDGVFTDAAGQSPRLTWAQLQALGIDDGPSDHDVTLQVRSGQVVELATARLTVTNTAPTAVVTGDLTATVGIPFTVKVGADDPSAADLAAQFTYTVDWGDGSPVETVVGPADPPVTHTYTAEGEYAAAFTAADADGGQSGPTSVAVQAVPAQSPTPGPTDTESPTEGPTTTASASPTSSDDLARTGAGSAAWLLAAGALLVVAGAALMALAGRRGAGLHE